MNESISDYLIEPACVGLVGAAATHFISGGKKLIIPDKGTISLAVLAGGAFFAGKIVDNLISNYVFPHIIKDENRSLQAPLSEALSVGTLATTSAAIHYMANNKSLNDLFVMIAAESLIAEIGGEYLARRFVIPFVDRMSA